MMKITIKRQKNFNEGPDLMKQTNRLVENIRRQISSANETKRKQDVAEDRGLARINKSLAHEKMAGWRQLFRIIKLEKHK